MRRILSCLFFVIFILFTEGQSFLIEPDQYLTVKDKITIDFRPLNEFKKQHVKNSINLNFEEMWRVFSENQQDFFSLLSSLGITPDKKVVLAGCDDKNDELLDCLAFAYLLYYGSFNDILILKGTIIDWQKRGIPIVSLGDEVLPKYWNYKLNEGIYYKQSKKNKAKKREVLISFDENVKSNNKFSRTIYIDIHDLQIKNSGLLEIEKLEEYFKRLQVTKENVLIIYPDRKKESFALAYLLKFYLNYDYVFILKGVL